MKLRFWQIFDYGGFRIPTWIRLFKNLFPFILPKAMGRYFVKFRLENTKFDHVCKSQWNDMLMSCEVDKWVARAEIEKVEREQLLMSKSEQTLYGQWICKWEWANPWYGLRNRGNNFYVIRPYMEADPIFWITEYRNTWLDKISCLGFENF